MRYGRLRAIVDSGLIALGVVLLAVGQPHRLIGDGYSRYLALSELLGRAHLADGDYSLVGPLFAAPLWIAGRLTGDPAHWLKYYNVTVLGLGLGAAYLLLRRRLDPTVLRQFLLLVVAGSMVAAAVADFYGEMFTTAAVGVGLLAATVHPRHPASHPVGRVPRIAGWTAVTLGAVNTPASLIGLGLVTGAQTVRARRLRLVPFAAAAVLVAVEIVVRNGGYVGNRGSQTIMPYSGRPGFSYPFVLGVAAILFSFGRGLVFFIPGLVLPARRRLLARDPKLAEIYLLWMLFLAGLVIAYASWWAWHGGMTWGPRFFLLGILPAALVLAVRLDDRDASPLAYVATLGVLALSSWVGAASTAFGQLWPPECSGGLESLCHFTPEFSPLWYPFVARPQLSTAQSTTLAYHVVVFGWLAAPLVVRLARSAAAQLRAAAVGTPPDRAAPQPPARVSGRTGTSSR